MFRIHRLMQTSVLMYGVVEWTKKEGLSSAPVTFSELRSGEDKRRTEFLFCLQKKTASMKCPARRKQ